MFTTAKLPEVASYLGKLDVELLNYWAAGDTEAFGSVLCEKVPRFCSVVLFIPLRAELLFFDRVFVTMNLSA